MIGSKDDRLKLILKEMIVQECDRNEINPEDILDDVILFSPDSKLDLDSIDALQIIVALHQQFGIRIKDSKEFKTIFTTINELADKIQPK
jgi:acyl carrier protein